MLPTIDLQDDAIIMVDQRKLPAQEVYVRCRTAPEVAKAIRTMVIRGAPAIGVAAPDVHDEQRHAAVDVAYRRLHLEQQAYRDDALSDLPRREGVRCRSANPVRTDSLVEPARPRHRAPQADLRGAVEEVGYNTCAVPAIAAVKRPVEPARY